MKLFITCCAESEISAALPRCADPLSDHVFEAEMHLGISHVVGSGFADLIQPALISSDLSHAVPYQSGPDLCHGEHGDVIVDVEIWIDAAKLRIPGLSTQLSVSATGLEQIYVPGPCGGKSPDNQHGHFAHSDFVATVSHSGSIHQLVVRQLLPEISGRVTSDYATLELTILLADYEHHPIPLLDAIGCEILRQLPVCVHGTGTALTAIDHTAQ